VGFWSWFGRRAPGDDRRLREWKRDWARALATLDPTSAPALRQRLNTLGLPEEDIEIEREMLDALEEAAALASEIARSGLPIVETGHRVVGRDACHFSAAASMPDEAGQPGGRLLLTSRRAIFVGGPEAVSTAWHMVGEARDADRDLLLIRMTRDRVYRFRCNSFSDAARAALIARELIRKRPA
jgi:hypothetical protein